MSNRPNRSKPPRPAAASAATQRRNRTRWIIGGAAALIVLALVIAIAAGGGSAGSKVATGASASDIVTRATHVPASVVDAVGVGTAQASNAKAISAPALVAGGKPEVLFIGAEYCPYCATERWAAVAALSRFGTFSHLGLTHSSSIDVYPDTATFTFFGSTYSSPYLSLSTVETETNQPQGSGYKPLQTPTAAQQQLFSTYGNGGVPFIDIGGRYVTGVTYDPALLQGKSAAEIAKALSDPNSDIAQGAVGSANLLTAMICQATGGQPGSVCNAPGVRSVVLPT